MIRTKADNREQIKSDTEKFLQSGGKITKLSISASARTVKKTESKVDYSALPAELKRKLGIKE